MKTVKKIFLALVLTLSLAGTRIQTVQAQTAGNTTQNFANLVLFVQFSDTAGNFMDQKQDYGDRTFTQCAVRDYTDTTYPKSLISYMDTISYGQFHVNTYMPQLKNDTVTPIQLSGTQSSYDDAAGIYLAEKQAMDLAQSQYSLSAYDLDQNSDGTVDNVTFIFAGEEDARGGVFYAHKNNFEASYQINQKYIGCINVLMAETIFGDDLSSTGEIAHEFMHSLGYPDLYHETDGNPVGAWDIMSQASLYNQWPLAYLRSSVSKWLNIETITSSQHLTLVPASQKDGDQAYILKTPLSDDEFFVVEYRKKGTQYSNELDVKIPGSGLIIYRINKKVENLNNRTGSADGVYVFRPGETSVTSDSGDLSKSFFGDTTGSGGTSYGSADLSKTISDGAIVYSDGQNSGIVLSNISAPGDTLSFDVSFANTSDIGVWNNLGGSSVVSTADSSVLNMAVNGTASYPSVLLGDWTDGTQGLNQNLAIYDYDGTAWKQSTSKITDYGNYASMAYLNGTPYVLYTSSANNYHLKLVKYQNGQWTTVSDQISTDTVNSLALQEINGSLYIAYDEGGPETYRNVIAKSNGTVINEIYHDTVGYYSDMHLQGSGSSAYFSARNFSAGNTVVAFDLTGDTVKTLPVPAAKYADAQIASDGTSLYLLCSDDGTTNETWLYQYASDHSSLSQVSAKVPGSNSDSSAISFYQGIPLVQVVDQDSPVSTSVWRYEDHAWKLEGRQLLSTLAGKSAMTMIGSTCYAAVMSGETPYVKMKSISVSQDDPSSGLTVTSIMAQPYKTAYAVGESFQAADLVVKATYSNMSIGVLSSKDYTVSGFDTAAAGTKNITVTSGTLSDTYQITVAAVTATGITVSPSSLSLTTGGTAKVTASLIPSTTTEKGITWSSSNAGAASVDSNGTVTAVAAGTATITAVSVSNPSKQAVCTVTVTKPTVTGIPMHRLYNPYSGEHLYTSSDQENNYLATLGWRQEGIGWIAPAYSNTPVYRLYNPYSGDHHYTISLSERNWLVTLGWRAEGIGWYSDDNHAVPIWRQFNPNEKIGTHNYTRSKSENDWLVTLGWRAEGIGWYGMG